MAFPRIHKGGVGIIVTACREHERNADILCDLVKDGIITQARVAHAERSSISREEFHELVAMEALAIWSDNETRRRHQNWCDSWELCLKELGRIPSPAERTERARRLWQERKDSQAVEDWLLAEKSIGSLYTVAS